MIGFFTVTSRIRMIGVVAIDCENTPLIRITRMLVTTNRSRCALIDFHAACRSSATAMANSTGAAFIGPNSITPISSSANIASIDGVSYTTQWCRTSSMMTSPSEWIRCRSTLGSSSLRRPTQTMSAGSGEYCADELNDGAERVPDAAGGTTHGGCRVLRLREQIERSEGDDRPDQ